MLIELETIDNGIITFDTNRVINFTTQGVNFVVITKDGNYLLPPSEYQKLYDAIDGDDDRK